MTIFWVTTSQKVHKLFFWKENSIDLDYFIKIKIMANVFLYLNIIFYIILQIYYTFIRIEKIEYFINKYQVSKFVIYIALLNVL